jgi:hypothetical protein
MEPGYDTSYAVWDYGMHHKNIDLNDLRERISTVYPYPLRFPRHSDKPVVFWSQMYGLKKNHILKITWISPSQHIWFSHEHVLQKDWWYYYFWDFIDNRNLPAGEWKVILDYNDQRVVEQMFGVDPSLDPY